MNLTLDPETAILQTRNRVVQAVGRNASVINPLVENPIQFVIPLEIQPLRQVFLDNFLKILS